LSIAEHAPAVDSSYAAPEVRKNGLAFADARSDVYSLSKVLLDLFGGDDADAANARSALDAGLAEEPSARASAKDIAEMLDLVAQPPALPAPLSIPQRWDEGYIIEWEHGRYRIVSQLGEGGVGRTFKLEQLDGQSEQPIGTFVGKLVVNPEIGPATLQAYRKIRSIADHPGLSGVYQTAGQWRPDALLALLKWRKGEPLESWRGDDLRVYAELTREDGRSDPEALLCGWGEQLCVALSVSHGQGWVHGDVSPSNILIDDDRATLIDFDLACPAGHIALASGTAPYASSSRRANKPARPLDDIFALAASLFHVLTNRLPFLFGGIRRDDAGLAWAEGERERYPRLADHLLAKDPHQLLGVDRADAADHARREVLFDAVDRGRRRGTQKPSLELLAMGAIVHPITRCRDPLAGGDRRGVADHGHEIPMSPRLGPQNAEAILGIVEGDALNESRQNFLR
jgi:serine/threonine protein kinase